jgi:hypothetical protein
MAVSVDVGDVIAGLALLLSGYATWQSVVFNKKQKSLLESQEKLNQRLLEKEDADSVAEQKADLGATIIKIGSNNYRLKIWNKGKATARNVLIDFPEGNDCFMESDIIRKFPLERLDTFQSVEIIAAVSTATKGKHMIRLRWADDFKSMNEKTLYPTL